MTSDPFEGFAGKRFLVTGGAGFIGSHLVDRLLSLGAQVVVLDDLSNGKVENLPIQASGLEVLSGDISSFDLGSLGRIDGVFSQAARALLPSFEDPITDMLVNAGGLVRVLEFARKRKIKVVHASSGSVYGNPNKVPISEDEPTEPVSPYGVSKLSSELYCSMYHREFGVDVTALRYFNVYGARQAVSEEMGVIPIFVRRALRHEQLTVFGDGKQTRDFLFVGDVVSANLLAFLSDRSTGRVMNIGGSGKELSILELAETVKTLCNSRSVIRFGPPKPGDIRRLAADSSLAKELIGYSPTVSLEEGLKRYIEYAR